MKRRVYAVLICLMATCALAGDALAQRTARPRARAAARADLSGPLARLFPSDTFLYVEVADLASVADEMGGVETFYALIQKELAKKAGGPDKAPLTLEEFRGLLGASFAFGVIVPESLTAAQMQSMDPVIVGVVRTTSRDAAALLAQVADEVRRTEGAREKPVVGVVGGARVTTLHASTPKSAFSFAQVGDTLVFGTPSGVTKILAPAARAKRLDDVPGFASAAGRVPGRRQAFAFLNGAPMVRAFNEGLAQAFQPAPKRGGRPAETPEAAALRAFLGVDAIVAGSLSALAESGHLAVQAALELDRSKGGLIPIVTDAPAIELRAAKVLPAETDLVYAQSLDALAIYDLVLRVATPALTKALHTAPPPEAIAAFEKKIDMRLRDDFLASFGNEFVFGAWIERTETLARVSDAGTKETVHIVGMAEVRNPIAVAAAISRLAASEGGPAPVAEAYHDTPVLRLGAVTFVYLDGFGIIGEAADVEHVIDSAKANRVLATSEDYAATTGGSIPNNVISATYMSPGFFAYAAKAFGNSSTSPSPTIASGLFVTLQKDATGVYTNFQLPLPNLRLLLDEGKPAELSRR